MSTMPELPPLPVQLEVLTFHMRQFVLAYGRACHEAATEFLPSLKHNSDSREVLIDDAFTAWVKGMPASHWAKHDLTAAAQGWNAAIEAAILRSVMRGPGDVCEHGIRFPHECRECFYG